MKLKLKYMTGKLILSVAALLVASIGFCQESDSKKINKIKRDTQYLYAEATMKDADEAFETALLLLDGYIDEYVQSKKKFSSSEQVIIKDTHRKSETIQMPRGEMTRVFVYVKKSDIIPAENSAIRENPARVPSEPELQETSGNQEAAELAEQAGEEAGLEEAGASPRLTFVWQQELIESLLETGTINSAKALLNREKAQFRVKRSGPAASCKDKAGSFWIIGDGEGKLITVLGPGTNRRTNFKTQKSDSLDNYPNSTALWFTLSE